MFQLANTMHYWSTNCTNASVKVIAFLSNAYLIHSHCKALRTASETWVGSLGVEKLLECWMEDIYIKSVHIYMLLLDHTLIWTHQQLCAQTRENVTTNLFKILSWFLIYLCLDKTNKYLPLKKAQWLTHRTLFHDKCYSWSRSSNT